MGKYSTCPMNKVWAFRRTLYLLDLCCIFSYRTKNEQRLYFLTRSSHIWHDCDISCIFQLKLQLECDMGWYRYTSHSENHCAECENKEYDFLCVFNGNSLRNRVFKGKLCQDWKVNYFLTARILSFKYEFMWVVRALCTPNLLWPLTFCVTHNDKL